MASSQRQPERVVHQDYIARIRYSNALPPPPKPPKLLDIPGTGLAGGEYTSAAYASRMVRDEPVNIEADAELGMPIDLIGIPGIFDGDERAISTRPNSVLHPHDKELLKPLASLGKGGGHAGAVSFLRRTEYTSSQGPQHFTSSTGKDLRLRNDPKRRKLNVNKDDPINIIRNVVKGFDVAYPGDAYQGEDSTTTIRGAAVSDTDSRAWSTPRHPTKPELQLLDSYPVLPDLEALPSTGCYMVAKFITNPVAATGSYDDRLDAALLRPKEDAQKESDFQQKLDEHDPASGKAAPLRDFDYDYYLPTEQTAVRAIKRKLNVNDPENEDPELYTDDLGDDQRAFKYARIRTYETYSQHGNPNSFYDDSVALALHDPDVNVGAVPGTKERLQKAAYFYPVIQRTALRPRRNVGTMAYSQQVEGDRVDELNLTVGEMDAESRGNILEKISGMDPTVQVEATSSAAEAAA